MMMNDTGKIYQIEIPREEVKVLLPAINGAYDRSTNIRQMAALKRLLQCLGCVVDDWTPLPERL